MIKFNIYVICACFKNYINYIMHIKLQPLFLRRFLNYKAHIFYTAAVFGAGGNDINSCGVDTAVT